MPVDNYDDEDDIKDDEKSGKRLKKEFDCPSCSANNPLDAPMENGDEVRCNYCGDDFKVKVTDEGRIKFKET